jgi:site-specific recombinase XerD
MHLIVIEYAKWLINARNFSKSTIETYVRAVNALDDYMKELTFGERGVELPHTIELDDVEEFAEREKLRGKKVTTVNNYLAGIKVFLKFCAHK